MRPAPPPLTRRALLAAGAALGLAAGTRAIAAAGIPSADHIGEAGAGDASAGDAAAARWLTARRHGSRHEAVLLDARGHDLAALGLGDRGHSFAIDAAGLRAVIFGRQPGFFAEAMALPSCASLGRLALPDDRHFFGHGVFSADGTRLFATENDFDAGRGVLGIYDARPGAGWQRLGEFDTAGIGPHEVVLLPDGRTLCVANGGLLTHPDFGKTPLNLATMRPSLVYLDAQDGRLLEQVRLPPELFQLSIRHLAVAPDGTVWFACQHEGPATEQPPLLGRHRRGAAPVLSGDAQVLPMLRNYLGSIAIDAAAGVVATSSPVGGSVAFWSMRDGRSLDVLQRPDGCGLAPLGAGRFLISDGFGSLVVAGAGDEPRPLLAPSTEVAWDNHLRRL